jgi:arylsulfatase A-like enzyme
VRIPLLVRWPKRYPAGRRLGEPVSLVDVTATIVDLAGADDAPSELESLDGLSLDGLMQGKSPDWP